MSVVLETITDTEQAHNDAQFNLLNPVNGFVTGNQAREVFMKSGLSVPILAQVWQLADYNKDGKMDRLEFSIAMHLIRCVLAGNQLPGTLPDSIKPASLILRMAGAPSSVSSSPIRPTAPVGTFSGSIVPTMMSNLPSGAVVGSVNAPLAGAFQATLLKEQTPNKIKGDWTIPHSEKLKYCQKFNQLDKQRTGALNGVHARNVLAQSQLPNVTLAEIWNLSDVNKDGRLSVEEFCIAMHLIDSVKAGFLLPKSLPPELMPAVVRMKSESPIPEPGAPSAQKNVVPKTFEDKRKDNYDRGQAELDRRRQILKEQEERRLAELERKEKEEAEKRERERIEAERRRQAEREAELQREREREAARLAEERRIAAEKEEVRKELERQRKAELDSMRIREATNQRQEEIDNTAERQQRKKTLSFQLQALTEKSSELNSDITVARERIVAITKEIEQMKEQRDNKITRIRQLEADDRLLSVQCEQLAHESLQLRVECSTGRAQEYESLRTHANGIREQVQTVQNELQAAEDRARLQQQLNSKKELEVEKFRNSLQQALSTHNSLREQIRALQQKAIEILKKRQEEQMRVAAAKSAAAAAAAALSQQTLKTNAEVKSSISNDTSPNDSTAALALPVAGTGTGAIKYRALYEFNARTDDELSFQPGDIILVFEGHAAEPGWLAGQMRDKVGWFPLAFAEPLAPVTAVSAQLPQTVSSVPTSPSSEPLESIIEEPSNFSKNTSVEAAPVNGNVAPSTTVESDEVIGVAVAQYQWKARNDSELSFSKNDKIEILGEIEMRWKGRNSSGQVGWFPKSYVKMLETDVPATEEKNKKAKSIVKAPKNTVSESVNNDTNHDSNIYDAVSAESSSAACGEWCIALYDFQASEPNDLNLKAGDRIWVTEAVDDWWKGTCNGQSGIFPANYVQKCPDVDASKTEEGDFGFGKAVAAFEATADNQLSLHVGDTVKIRSKSAAGWWQGEITMSSGTKKVGWFPGNYVELQNEGEIIFEALYDYTAQRSDELTFACGDLIVVTDRSDAEWWKGHLKKAGDDADALFPANYVRVSVVDSARNHTRETAGQGTSSQSKGAHSASFNDEHSVANPKLKKLTEASWASVSLFWGFFTKKFDVGGSVTNSQSGAKKRIQLISWLAREGRGQRKVVGKSFIAFEKELVTKLFVLRSFEELYATELRFLRDLKMCRKLFANNLAPVIGEKMTKELFINIDELISISGEISNALKTKSPGDVFVEKTDLLHAYVKFCSQQQRALEVLNDLELNNLAFKKAYRRCCENPNARGLNLSYLILLPMGRITRYPLIFEKLIKYTPKDSPKCENLEIAHQLLKARCAEVNNVISEMDNANMLLWAQQHIHCDPVKPSDKPLIVFPSRTRYVGPRLFYHAGVLYKQRSGRVLVGFVFSDFILLTTPREPLEKVDDFKVTKHAEIHLNMYKTPLLLSDLIVVYNKESDENTFSLKSANTETSLRALDRNARVLWISQIEKAIDNYQIEISRLKKPVDIEETSIGSLLVELVCVKHLEVESRATGGQVLVCKMELGNARAISEVNLNSGENLSTQLPITSIESTFQICLYIPRIYSPDICAGVGTVSISDLLSTTASHRGPISRRVDLISSEIPSNQPFVILKFVVQMFY